MGTFRDKPLLAVGLLVIALVALAFSLYWTLVRTNQPAVPPPSNGGAAPTTQQPTPPVTPNSTAGQTVPY